MSILEQMYGGDGRGLVSATSCASVEQLTSLTDMKVSPLKAACESLYARTDHRMLVLTSAGVTGQAHRRAGCGQPHGALLAGGWRPSHPPAVPRLSPRVGTFDYVCPLELISITTLTCPKMLLTLTVPGRA